MAYFESTIDFDSAIAEIDYLIAVAKEEDEGSHRFSVNLKAALVLLASKLEAYVENIVEEYIDKIAVLNPKSKHLPKRLRDHSTVFLLDLLNRNCGFSDKQKNIELLTAASALWHDNTQLQKIRFDGKFSYGKHGSGELEALFKRVGIEDIYIKCQVLDDESESMVDAAGKISVAGDIDSLTNIRNNIIHSDANPNFTLRDIEAYRNKIWEFCYQIDRLLDQELASIENKMLQEP